MTLACQYAIVRFQPHAETGEFANIGVVLACPTIGYFGVLLLAPEQTGRITRFFAALDRKVFFESMAHLTAEATRLQALLDGGAAQGAKASALAIFQHYTRPREGLIQYSETRALLVEHPQQALTRLFDRYVQRDQHRDLEPDGYRLGRGRLWQPASARAEEEGLTMTAGDEAASPTTVDPRADDRT